MQNQPIIPSLRSNPDFSTSNVAPSFATKASQDKMLLNSQLKDPSVSPSKKQAIKKKLQEINQFGKSSGIYDIGVQALKSKLGINQPDEPIVYNDSNMVQPNNTPKDNTTRNLLIGGGIAIILVVTILLIRKK